MAPSIAAHDEGRASDRRPLLTTMTSSRALYLNVLVLAASLTTTFPMNMLLALVDHIAQTFSPAIYETVVGLLYVTALPVAYAQLSFDRGFDQRYESRASFVFRLGLATAVLIGASAGLARLQVEAVLLSLAFVIGCATWIANGTLSAVAGLLPSEAFVWQGLGAQAASLAAYGAIALVERVNWNAAWLAFSFVPALGLAAGLALVRDPHVEAQMEAKDVRTAASAPAAERPRELDDAITSYSRILAAAMLLSVVVAGSFSFFAGTYRGLALSTLAYLAFNGGNIVSRFVVAAADRALAPPSARALDAVSVARAGATALVFAGAFGHVAWLESGPSLVALFFAYALAGGMLATWAFKLTKEACGDNQDFAVEASRTNTFAQNLGLSIGGAISCALAVGFGAFR